jgi:hypothetical protein
VGPLGHLPRTRLHRSRLDPHPESSGVGDAALDVHKTIHTAAKKSIDDAVKWTDHLVTEIRAAIDLLGQAVDDAQEAQAA